MIARRLEAQGDARRKLVEVALAPEIGARRAERHARAAKDRRAAAQIILPQDARAALVPRVAATDRQAELIGELVGEVSEDREGLRRHVRLGEGGEAGKRGEQAHVELRVRLGIEIIAADEAGERAAIIIEKLQFLAELLIAIISWHIEIDRGQRVEIDGRSAVILAPAGDRAGGEATAQLHRRIGREAVSLHILLGIDKAAARIEHVAEHRRAGDETGGETMAAARLAVVLGIVARDAQQHRLAIAAQLQRAARRPDVLVIVVLSRRQVRAEAAAREPRERTADAHDVANGRGDGDDPVSLIVAAIGALDLERELLRELLGHIFDRAADRIAAVQRALRPAQHLDALDIIDIQHGRLRTVEVDVVQIDAHALLETGYRILLADAADEGRERRVRPARGFQRDVGHHGGNVGHVERAALVELGAAEGGNRDRHIDQSLLAAAGGHDDRAGIFVAFSCLRRRSFLRMHGRSDRQAGGRQHGGKDEIRAGLEEMSLAHD